MLYWKPKVEMQEAIQSLLYLRFVLFMMKKQTKSKSISINTGNKLVVARGEG